MRPSKIALATATIDMPGVMRHVVEDDGMVSAFRHALRRVVDRIVVTVAAERADRLQPLKIARSPRAA